jgi:tetratricopeptide (TPR) repeat protein
LDSIGQYYYNFAVGYSIASRQFEDSDHIDTISNRINIAQLIGSIALNYFLKSLKEIPIAKSNLLVKSYAHQGSVYQFLMNYDKSGKCFLKGLELKPNSIENLYGLAFLKFGMDKYPEAIAYADKILKLILSIQTQINLLRIFMKRKKILIPQRLISISMLH